MRRLPVTRRASWPAAAVVALTVAACGEPESAGQPGRLVVQKSLAGMPIFIEGSITHLRLVGKDGGRILDDLRPVETLDEPLLDRRLPPGAYDLIAVERPCQGNCDFLDPPAESTRCKLGVTVEGGRTTRVAIVLSRGSGDAGSRCSATTER